MLNKKIIFYGVKDEEEKNEVLKAINDSGGVVSLNWVKEFLNINEKDVLYKIKRNQILALNDEDENLIFPRFQFNMNSRNVYPSINGFLEETKNWLTKDIIIFLFSANQKGFKNYDLVLKNRLSSLLLIVREPDKK